MNRADSVSSLRNAQPFTAQVGLEVPEDIGLPGESWWEVVERREYVKNLVNLARTGAINSASECIANNLDVDVLAIDVIDALDNPRDVVAVWEALTTVKVVDPTCGSSLSLRCLEHPARFVSSDLRGGSHPRQDL